MFYNVAPRYTGGSPASVDRLTAERVAAEELDGYRMALEGVYGPAAVTRAQALGVEGIVELRTERGRGWEILDLISDRKCFRFTREWRETEQAWRRRIDSARRNYSRDAGWIVQALELQEAR